VWSDILPNLLIALREGLEAGLIVSILIATLVRGGHRARLPQVWTGVVAAIALSLSFGAVLTFAADAMSTRTQEGFSGFLSLTAVVLVTMMIFWMRRSARALAGDIKEKVAAALDLGPGILVLTAFLCVAREGLETSLFLWTTTRGARESAGPLIGAAIGLVLAVAICIGMYRKTVKVNLTRFFTWTGGALIVIASGVTGYGLRDLQEGGVLPGLKRAAFDVSSTIAPGAWYARLVDGVLNLTPQMTVLQVIGYLTYLVVVMTVFVLGGRAATKAAKAPAAATAPVAAPARTTALAQTSVPAQTSGAASTLVGATAGATAGGGGTGGAGMSGDSGSAGANGTAGYSGTAGGPAADGTSEGGPPAPAPDRRAPRWALPVALVAVPAVAAAVVIAVIGPSASSGATIDVANGSCAAGWKAPKAGKQTFTIRNTSGHTDEVRLIDPATGAIHAEIEQLGPGTSRPLDATIGGGTYAWDCLPDTGATLRSATRQIAGPGVASTAIIPVTDQTMAAPLAAYRAYVTTGLATVAAQVGVLRADIDRGDLAAARRDWLPAHLSYERLGAAYGTFGDFDADINGRPGGLAGGMFDPDFRGFHRIEAGLWHGESAHSLAPVAARLASDVAGLRQAFPGQDFDPGDLALRSHEILENSLQFQLTGIADWGSGTTLATTSANVDGTRELLKVIAPVLSTRDPRTLAAATSQLDAFGALVNRLGDPHGTWIAPANLPAIDQETINGSLSSLLETLAPIPDVLEIRSAG
jgi:high-affinity iron transporter